MANRNEVFQTVYQDNPTTDNPEHKSPKVKSKVKEGDLTIPEFYDIVKPLHQVVDVDYFIPNQSEAASLTGQASPTLAARRLRELGVTDGLLLPGWIVAHHHLAQLGAGRLGLFPLVSRLWQAIQRAQASRGQLKSPWLLRRLCAGSKG
jgi:hypothetical protein